MKIRIKDDVTNKWIASKYKGQIIDAEKCNNMYRSKERIDEGDYLYVNFEHAVELTKDNMTVGEFRERKTELAKRIADILNEFKSETDICVTGIELGIMGTLDGLRVNSVKVKTETI